MKKLIALIFAVSIISCNVNANDKDAQEGQKQTNETQANQTQAKTAKPLSDAEIAKIMDELTYRDINKFIEDNKLKEIVTELKFLAAAGILRIIGTKYKELFGEEKNKELSKNLLV